MIDVIWFVVVTFYVLMAVVALWRLTLSDAELIEEWIKPASARRIRAVKLFVLVLYLVTVWLLVTGEPR